VIPFSYVRASDVAEAAYATARDERAHLIAGGTNLLDLMKDGVETPLHLVDINALSYRAIERTGDAISIGALARMSDVASDPSVREAFPMVAMALEQSASPQLRNMASMGGNILQRTRCPYFRDVATPCNKREPGSGCGAIGGVNRMQAVLGTSEHCIATHASDVAVAFTALDVIVRIDGAHGQREMTLSEFYRLPGSTPHVENALDRGELIAGFRLPLLRPGTRSTYLKVRDRLEYDFPLASAAVALQVDRGIVRAARIALGGVATIPWRSRAAEDALIGNVVSREQFERAADLALSGARGYGENDFKITLAQRTLVRALESVA
jgi:xanthine dehydrogenase YagS FAD-binding subunit